MDGIEGINGGVGLGSTDSHFAEHSGRSSTGVDAVMGSCRSSPLASVFLLNRKQDNQQRRKKAKVLNCLGGREH